MPNYNLTLRAARINAGFTLEQAAAVIDMKPGRLAKFEVDCGKMDIFLVCKLVAFYGCTIDMIHFGKESECLSVEREPEISKADKARIFSASIVDATLENGNIDLVKVINGLEREGLDVSELRAFCAELSTSEGATANA